MKDCRPDFPIFDTHPDLVYLDSAATTQKPLPVIEAVSKWYKEECASVHRGIYSLSEASTAHYEEARKTVARFINAASEREVVFTRSTTDSLNLIAGSIDAWLSSGHSLNLAGEIVAPWKAGDTIVLSLAEHHSNLLPWRRLAERHGMKLEFVRLSPEGELDRGDLASKITGRTRLVALTLCSNVTGSITSMDEVTPLLSRQGSRPWVVLDAAQAAPHFPIDVQALGADFLAFSGHKVYGPSGIGVLYGRLPYLEAIPPYQSGGSMVLQVMKDSAVWAPPPQKFEAGTPNIEGAIGLMAALSYLKDLGGMEAVSRHTANLAIRLKGKLASLPNVRIIGNPDPRSGIVSFTVEGIHPHDVADLLNRQNIAIRAGHHCAGPLHEYLGLTASNRISLGIYNTEKDIETLMAALSTAIQVTAR